VVALSGLLTAASATPANADEAKTTPAVTGELELIAVDRPDGTGHTSLAVVTDTGEILPVDPGDLPVGVAEGDRVEIRNGTVAAATELAAARPDLESTQLAAAKTQGVRSILVIPTNVNGTDGTDFSGPVNDLDLYIQEASAGQLRLSATLMPWISVPPPALGACDSNASTNIDRVFDLMNKARVAADAAGWQTGSYDTLVLYSPYISGCAFSGLATVGGGLVWIARNSFNRGILAHELGHNLGAPHAQSLDCGGAVWAAGCTGRAYGDPFSVLGWAGNGGHYSTPEQHSFGWLRAGEVVPAANGTVRLNAVASTATGPTAITVPASNGQFWLEYRAARGYDGFVAGNGHTAGVQVRWVPAGGHPIPSDPGPLLLDGHPGSETAGNKFKNAGFGPGETWTDPSGRFRFSMGAADVNGVNVTITDVTAPPPAPPTGPAQNTALGTFKAITPTRLVDTRPTGIAGSGTVEVNVVSPSAVNGLPTSSGQVSGAVLNLTVTGATNYGYLSAYPCGEAPPGTSSLNFGPGDTTAAAVLVKTGGGKVCVLTSVPGGRVDVIADVNGWFASASTSKGSRLTARAEPVRVADTRHNGVPVRAGQTLGVRVAGVAGIPADATAAMLSLTVTESPRGGYVAAYPCGGTVPQTSSVNMFANQTRNNTVVVGLDGSGGVCFFTPTDTHIVVDVMGTFGPSGSMSGLRFEAETPARVLDTRSLARPVPPGGIQTVPVSGTPALTVTSADAWGEGFVTVFDCYAATVPQASNLIFQAARDRANAVVVQSTAPCAYVNQTTHLVVDRTGKFLP
jgi:hypothetical protein